MMTPEQETMIDCHCASMTISYVLGYIKTMEDRGVLPDDGRQHAIGRGNAERDIKNGVLALWDLDLTRSVQCLLDDRRLPLESKRRADLDTHEVQTSCNPTLGIQPGGCFARKTSDEIVPIDKALTDEQIDAVEKERAEIKDAMEERR